VRYGVRPAGFDDVDSVVETITLAFHEDPVWSWVFPDALERPSNYRRWWPLFVESVIPAEWVWMTAASEAVSVWVPPGYPELTLEAEAALEPILVELVGAHASAVLSALDQFAAAHPHDAPSYYLSMLATHADHRGHGIGVELLSQNLALIDRQGAASYLESSNPANLTRYERLGFVARSEFTLPAGGPTVTTMWREGLR
jgi:GNAT superfamily N-acetyltransferase